MLKITLEITSTTELQGLENALALYIDMERERAKDGKAAGWTHADAAKLKGAERVYAIITGEAA